MSGVQAVALPMTVSKVDVVSFTWVPADPHDAISSLTASVWVVIPVANCMLNVSGVPLGIPAPHWLAPDPASVQVSVPPGLIFQPCELNSCVAFVGLYG